MMMMMMMMMMLMMGSFLSKCTIFNAVNTRQKSILGISIHRHDERALHRDVVRVTLIVSAFTHSWISIARWIHRVEAGSAYTHVHRFAHVSGDQEKTN